MIHVVRHSDNRTTVLASLYTPVLLNPAGSMKFDICRLHEGLLLCQTPGFTYVHSYPAFKPPIRSSSAGRQIEPHLHLVMRNNINTILHAPSDLFGLNMLRHLLLSPLSTRSGSWQRWKAVGLDLEQLFRISMPNRQAENLHL